jgi:site-specific DNA-cytosine methylase
VAGRNRAVLSGRSGDSFSRGATSERYTYLPWVDLVCAGVPCQDWSVAGKRAGLSGTHSSLVYQFARILHTLRPTWFLFENVPGLLSSNNGRDFAEVLRLFMVKCGYGIQWRVLDSQFFGVAQRRRRLFIVGRFGKPCPPEVLFEPESGAGDFAQGQETWTGVAAPLTSGIGVTSNAPGRRREDDINLAVALKSSDDHRISAEGALNLQCAAAISASTGHHGHSSPRGDGSDNLIAAPITASYGKQVDSSDTNGGPPNLILGRQPTNGHSRLLHAGERPDDARETAFCLRVDPGGIGQGHNTTYAITENMRNRSQGPGNYVVGSLDASRGGPDDNAAQAGHLVPDIRPQERALHFGCNARGNDEHDGDFNDERAPLDTNGMRDFAGLPKGLDSPRYRALGNAVTVSVIEWIGRRIVACHEQTDGGQGPIPSGLSSEEEV